MSRSRGKKRTLRDEDGSLIEMMDAQGTLFVIEPHPVEAEATETKQCTGELLAKRDPEAYQAIVEALAAEMPIRRIKKLWGVGTQTVYAILRREKIKVGTLKERIAQTLYLAGMHGAERAAELIEECDDAVQAAMATKMLLETGNLMKGQATSIQEHHVISVDATSAAARVMEKAREMGLETGGKLALREVGPPPALPLIPTSGAASLDCLSAADEALDVGVQQVADSCHTPRHTSPPVPPDFEDGGGGDPPRPDPGPIK